MNILMTGISSFTGLHFVKALQKRGHTLIGVHQSPLEDYSVDYKQRLTQALSLCEHQLQASFGDPQFCQYIQQVPIDVYCHHGAYTTQYSSADFPIQQAIQQNTLNLDKVSTLLQKNGCHSIVVSSSIFAGNGPVTSGIVPFSGYGESKWRTDQLFSIACHQANLRCARFVIPNPFGPFDNPKLPLQMAKQWSRGLPLHIKTPLYIRDNIHVRLLAEHYASWIEALPQQPSYTTSLPSGYVESVHQFSERVAKEIRLRTGWRCEIIVQKQEAFPQPRILHNTTSLLQSAHRNEVADWDALAKWFQSIASSTDG